MASITLTSVVSGMRDRCFHKMARSLPCDQIFRSRFFVRFSSVRALPIFSFAESSVDFLPELRALSSLTFLCRSILATMSSMLDEEAALAASTVVSLATAHMAPVEETNTNGRKPSKRLCRYPGCTRVIKSQGHCQRHGARAKRCRIEGCEKQAQGTVRIQERHDHGIGFRL